MSNKRTAMWANTRVSARLGIKYPIIQGPLGGLSSQRLTAAVSNYGGLGYFGGHGVTPSAIKDVIAELLDTLVSGVSAIAGPGSETRVRRHA